VKRENPVRQGPEVSGDLLVLLVSKESVADLDGMEREEPLDLLDPRESLELRDCLGFPVTRVNVVSRAPRVSRVPLAQQAWLVMMDHLDCPEYPVKWELGVFPETEALQVCLVHLAYLELKDLLGLRAMKDHLGHQDRLDKLETRDPLELPVPSGH